MSEEKQIGEYPGISNAFFEHLKISTSEEFDELYQEGYSVNFEDLKVLKEFLEEKLQDAYQLGWRVGYGFHKEQEEGKL